jgi:hypothetical protein
MTGSLKTPANEEANPDEVYAVLDRRAEETFGLSAEEFLEALHHGKYDDVDTPAVLRRAAIAAPCTGQGSSSPRRCV